MMTPEEFWKRMKAAFAKCATDEAHSAGDDLMCELLRALGYGEGVAVFEAAEKWYA